MSKKRILVIDDEVEIVSALQIILEHAGYEVLTASEGMEGLIKAKEQKPDLVVLDLLMPKLNGYQVCRMLKFDKAYSHIPIIMLTALSSKDDQEWGRKTNADDYIIKPFESKDLINKIKALLVE